MAPSFSLTLYYTITDTVSPTRGRAAESLCCACGLAPAPPHHHTHTSHTHTSHLTPHRGADPAASPSSISHCSLHKDVRLLRGGASSVGHRSGSYFITIPLRKFSRSADATWQMDDSKPSCAMCALSSVAASTKALPKLLRPSPFQ